MADEHVDHGAEKAVVGALMLAGSLGQQATGHEILDVEDFHDPGLRMIFQAILHVEESGGHPDPVSVSARLREKESLDDIGGAPRLLELEDGAPSLVNIAHWSEILVKVGRRRRAAALLERAIERFNDDPEATTDRLIAHLSGLTAEEIDRSSQAFSSMAYAAEMEDRAQRRGGLSTGFPSLDGYLQGLGTGLHIIAARPSCGKSALAIAVARHVGVMCRRPVLIISMEMSRMQIDDRIVSAEARIPATLIKRGTLDMAHHDAFARTMNRIDGAPIAVVDKGNPSVREIVALSRQWASIHQDCALIIIDYLQLASGRGDTREQEVASVSRACKAISVDLGLPVMALSQLNRAVKSGDVPGLHNLRESGSIEQDADTVTFIHFDGSPSELDVADLIIAKNRNGACGKASVGWDATCVRFYELD